MDSMVEAFLNWGHRNEVWKAKKIERWTSHRDETLSKILQLPEIKVQQLIKEMKMAINTNVSEIGSRIKVHNTEVRVNVVGTLLYWDLLDELKTLGLVQQIEDKLTRYRNRILDKVLQLPKSQLEHLVMEMEFAITQVLERIPANPSQPNLLRI